jgi:site-specific recombinase XerD
MKITKTVHNGNVRYRVNEAQGQDGKRQRKFFDSREAAEQYVKERTADTRAFGIHIGTIPASERAAIAYQLGRLKTLGWTLPAAVDFIEKNGKAAPSMPLGTVADEFLLTKENGGLRRRYLKTLKASIKRFLLGRRQSLIADITPAEIQEYVSSNGWQPATKRSYLVDVRTLFAFALKRKYIRENPALAVDLPKVEELPPGIISPEQARSILETCLQFAPDALPVIVLQLFGGLRRSEAEELSWDAIGDEFIEVKAHLAKTRRRRLNKITPQLKAWLDTARSVGGKLPALNYADKFKLILEKAKLRHEWDQNALRHSFASYHYAKFKNENETAALMGNSPQMVFRHYRELVRPEIAERYFAIMPPADAVKQSEKARQRKPRVMPPRESKITSAILAAVFEAGQLSLPRKEAVAAIVARTKTSVAAAYNALSLEGRFKSNLFETDGKLSWKIAADTTGQKALLHT